MAVTTDPETLAPIGSSLIPLSIAAMKERRAAIDQFVKECLQEDVHFGVIPGTNKPTLLKPGAELMCSFFCLAPKFTSEEILRDGDHLTLTIRCDLMTYDGKLVGSGRGTCSTKEKKYAWRHAARTCPSCSVEAIIKGKEEYGGGWVCFKKKGGCGAKFQDGDASIEGQSAGQVPNPDIADTYNTVQKIGDKRALVAAVLVTLGVSDKFTQDLDEDGGHGEDGPRQQAPAGASRNQPQRAAASQQQRPAAQPTRAANPFGGAPAPGNGKPAAPAPEASDPRPAMAQEILAIRDTTWDQPPSPQGWAKITTYHLGRPTPDTIYGDGVLASADPEKLGALLTFMRALKAADDSATADLTDILSGRDPKARAK